MARSPADWRDLLSARLHQRWNRIQIYDAYYEGDHRLAFATSKWNETFAGRFGRIADNWCEIIVDSAAERLKVQGFRFGKTQDADDAAWDIWQANNLDGASSMVHTEAIKCEEAYWLIQPNGNDVPRITAEHPQQVIVAHEPGDATKRVAALKKWVDDDGWVRANVYLPDRVVKYQAKRDPAVLGQDTREKWETIGAERNPLDEVPVVPVRNNPSMLHGGRSDLKVALSLQDALNKELSDMLIGSEYLAFPQRVLIGADVPRGEDGLPLKSSELKASQSRLWVFKNVNAKVAEFSAADLTNYTSVRDNLLRSLTAKTRIPPHYVLGEITNASGDALKAAEVGLVMKVNKKKPDMGEGHEEAMRLAFKAIGDDERAGAIDAETIWADSETRSFGELVDGVTKEVAIGLPFEIALEKLGYSPQEIDRILAIKESEGLLAEALPTTGQVPPEAAMAALTNGGQ